MELRIKFKEELELELEFENNEYTCTTLGFGTRGSSLEEAVYRFFRMLSVSSINIPKSVELIVVPDSISNRGICELPSVKECEESPKCDRIRSVCKALESTLLAKNANYGSAVFQRPSLAPNLDPGTAIRVRLSDKFARLQSLLSGEPDRVGESVCDTILDIAGYCVLYLAEKEKEE